jgi:hypothetical protein
MVIIGWAIVWVAVIAAICFLAYLGSCWLVVTKTGSTEGLRDVATAMRAYRLPIAGRRRR